MEDFALPRIITEITGQTTVPIGDGVIATKDTVLGRSIFFLMNIFSKIFFIRLSIPVYNDLLLIDVVIFKVMKSARNYGIHTPPTLTWPWMVWRL